MIATDTMVKCKCTKETYTNSYKIFNKQLEPY